MNISSSEKIEYDPSLKAPIGYQCPELSKNDPQICIQTPADKCLLFLLRGLAFHWKQISGYEFVGIIFVKHKNIAIFTAFVMTGAKNQSPQKLLAMISDLIKEAHDAGIMVKVVTTDMASENQALWSLVNVFANRRGHNCLFQNPAQPSEKIVFMPDPPHALKNLKSAAMSYKIQVPQWLFQKYNLTDLDPKTNTVNLKFVILRLIEIQEENNVVFVDGLDKSYVFPQNYEKMRMKFTLKIIDYRVVAAIEMCVAEGIKYDF